MARKGKPWKVRSKLQLSRPLAKELILTRNLGWHANSAVWQPQSMLMKPWNGFPSTSSTAGMELQFLSELTLSILELPEEILLRWASKHPTKSKISFLLPLQLTGYLTVKAWCISWPWESLFQPCVLVHLANTSWKISTNTTTHPECDKPSGLFLCNRKVTDLQPFMY